MNFEVYDPLNTKWNQADIRFSSVQQTKDLQTFFQVKLSVDAYSFTFLENIREFVELRNEGPQTQYRKEPRNRKKQKDQDRLNIVTSGR